MKKNAETIKKVQSYIKSLRERGIRYEEIAYKCDTTYPAVVSWAAGNRCPNRPMVEYIEKMFGVKK